MIIDLNLEIILPLAFESYDFKDITHYQIFSRLMDSLSNHGEYSYSPVFSKPKLILLQHVPSVLHKQIYNIQRNFSTHVPKLASLVFVFYNLKINTITYSVSHKGTLEVKNFYFLSHTPVSIPLTTFAD